MLSPQPPVARHILAYAQSLDGGGVERALLRLAAGWIEAGREVTLVIGKVDGPLAAELPPGLRVIELGSRAMIELSGVHRHVARLRPDLIFCPGNHYSGIAAWTRLRLGGASPPIVAKISNALVRRDHRGLMIPAYRFWLRRQPRFIDHFVAMTRGMWSETVAMMRVPPARVSIIPNPPTPMRPDLPAPAIPPGRYLLGVGRLEQQKRWDRLIAALPRIGDPEVQLVLVGEGIGRPQLEAQIAALGLDARVSLPGYLTDPSPLLARAAALVLTSDFEGVPNVVREALAAGTPVVSTDSSVAVREILGRPEWGTVVPIDDGTALVAAIEDWLAPGKPRPDPVPQPGLDSAVRYLELFDQICAARVSL